MDECEAVVRDTRKTHRKSTHELNCLEKDQKYVFCTAEHPSTSGPNHLPSYPSFVFLLFWLTSLWLHAVVAGNRSPPLNAGNTCLMSTDCWQNNRITYYIILLNQHTVLHLLYIYSFTFAFYQYSGHLLFVLSVLSYAAKSVIRKTELNESKPSLSQIWTEINDWNE